MTREGKAKQSQHKDTEEDDEEKEGVSVATGPVWLLESPICAILSSGTPFPENIGSISTRDSKALLRHTQVRPLEERTPITGPEPQSVSKPSPFTAPPNRSTNPKETKMEMGIFVDQARRCCHFPSKHPLRSES